MCSAKLQKKNVIGNPCSKRSTDVWSVMPSTSLPCSPPASKINASKLSDAANTVVVTLWPLPFVRVIAPARASKNRNSDVSTNFGCGCPEHLGGCPTQHCGCPGTHKSIQIDTYGCCSCKSCSTTTCHFWSKLAYPLPRCSPMIELY